MTEHCRVGCAAGSALPAPSPAHLRAVEEYFEVTLPDDYVQLLATCNGGVPSHRCFAVGTGQRTVERFLPVLEAAESDDQSAGADVEVVATQLDARLATDPDATAIDLLPVAALFGGDFVVLDFRASRSAPSVGVWDHEASDDFAPAVRTVARDVTAFLAMLHEG